MSNLPTTLAIVGVGKIVRDQHLPAIERNANFDLIAAASRNATIDGIANYQTIEQMIEDTQQLNAVALCMPPQYRYHAARYALLNGLNVLLEKPPGATVSEVESLIALAQEKNVSLFATWHSRFAAAVETAKATLFDTEINSVKIVWKEDVRKWHVGQQWIWQPGGLGVFDPGINALSILTHLLPEQAFVTSSELYFPANKAAPIAAQLSLSTPTDTPVSVELDWRQTEGEVWEIEFQTKLGLLSLTSGGEHLFLDGAPVDIEYSGEYENIYKHFDHLLKHNQSDVDLAPLKLVADAFMLGSRELVAEFL